MFRVVEVEAMQPYRICLAYADGAKGEVDLSHLVGKGVFEALEDRQTFEAVHIGDYGQIAFNEEIELCPDTLYMELTDKTAEEVFPTLRDLQAGA